MLGLLGLGIAAAAGIIGHTRARELRRTPTTVYEPRGEAVPRRGGRGHGDCRGVSFGLASAGERRHGHRLRDRCRNRCGARRQGREEASNRRLIFLDRRGDLVASSLPF